MIAWPQLSAREKKARIKEVCRRTNAAYPEDYNPDAEACESCGQAEAPLRRGIICHAGRYCLPCIHKTGSKSA